MQKSVVYDESKKFKSKSYGATGNLIAGHKLEPMEIDRYKPKNDEVLIEVMYCGVCHSDIHQVNNDWKNTIYPSVPGHEIIGKIVQIGQDVLNLKVGQVVGVGCMINSCQTCKSCESGEEQFCLGPNGMTMTYNGYFKPNGETFNTFGGFSTHIVANKSFVLSIPDNLDLLAAAPILCAGITTYSPLKHWGIKPGDKVGIIGIGGLGHMGVMIAKAMGATVVAITTKESKRKAALALGADDVIVSENKSEMEAQEITFDFLLCTIPDKFDVNPYICLLAPRGSLVTVGLLAPYETATNNMEVAKFGRSVGGSLIGGIAETQEVLEFCADHNILPQVQMIKMDDINKAFAHINDEDVRFRYVIDMQGFGVEKD